ncbi:RraA family protein [Pseudomonas graminis]|uniref:RraA family protein n=1 Tax=Pseudomonas graminis TaxID=158627 RepID=UPI0023491214|nr:RraA family protein [Pseudomonas graminis]
MLKVIHTSTLADVLDSLGIWGVLDYKITNLNGQASPLYGRAMTVRWVPIRKGHSILAPQSSTWEQVKDFLIPGVAVGEQMVYVAGVDGGLLPNLALAGGFSATHFAKLGIRGIVLGGAIRDAHIIKNLQIPVFATNYTPSDTQGSYRVAEVGGSCEVGGIHVHTGDYIFADESGCVVIPQTRFEEVVSKAYDIEAAEEKLEEALVAGLSLHDAVLSIGRL